MDVGNYKVVVSAETTDEYFAAKAEKAFEITRANADLKFTEEGDKSITYTGNKVKAGLATDENAKSYDITYSYDGDGEVTATWYGSTDGNKNSQALDSAPKDAGTYYVVLAATEGKNYNAAAEVAKKVTITQATATITINDIAEIPYSGDEVTASLASAEDASKKNITYTYNGDSGTINVKWYKDNNGNKGEELTNGAPEKAGTYWIGVSATEGTNYTAAAEATKKFTIAKKNASLAFADSNDYTTTYNNSAVTVGTGDENIKCTYDGDGNITPVWYNSNADGEIDKTSSLTTAPTNAGTYYIVLTATEGDNYNKVTEGPSKKVTINKATAEITINNIEEITYSGKAVTVGISNADITYSHTGDVTIGSDNINWYDSSNNALDGAPKDAGTYYIGISASEGTNYKAVTTEVQKQFKIVPYTISNTIATTEATLTSAEGTINDPTITGVNGGAVSGTYTYTYTDGTTTVTGKDNVIAALIAKPNGNYSVTVQFTAAANSNYTGTATGTITVTVNKPTPEITFSGLNDITYDGAIVTAGKKPEEGKSTDDITYTYAGNNDNVTVTWYSSDDQVLGEAPKDAGSYKVGIKAAADSTYNEVTEQKESFTILKKTIGNTISGTATIKADTADFVDPTISGAVGTETVPGDYTYTYSETTGKSDVINALKAEANGTYTVNVKFEPKSDSNYKGDASGTISVTVQKETPTITITPANNITYDGSAVEVGTSGTTGADITYAYQGNNENITITWYASKEDGSKGDALTPNEAPTNAGKYYIGIKAAADSTYNEVTEQFKEFTISKKQISTTITGATATIEANTAKLTAPEIKGLNNEKVEGTYSYEYGDAKTEEAVIAALKALKNGEYDVKVTFTADDSNYQGTATGTMKVTVNKTTPEIAITVGSNITYDGEKVEADKTEADITYTYAGDSKNVTVTWYSSDDNVLEEAPTAAGSYKVGIKAAADSTYNEVAEKTANFTILMKSIDSTISGTATITADTETFDDPTISGAVGTETVPGDYTYTYSGTTGKSDVINALKAEANGTYTVNVKFEPKSDSNYKGEASGTISVTVQKDKPTITITPKETITYDKQKVEVKKADATDTADITYTYTGDGTEVVKWYKDNNGNKNELAENEVPTDAGKYYIGISAPATTSYDKVDETFAQFEIKKAGASITFDEPGTITYDNAVVKAGTKNTEDADITYTYDGDSTSFTTTWYASDAEGSIDTSKSIGAPEEVGTYYVEIKAAAGENYNAVTKQQKFTISQAPASITITEPSAITYDGKAVKADVSTAADLTDVDIKYTQVGDGEPVIEWYKGSEKLDTAPTDAGSYSVKISAEASKNYKAADVKELSFTILKKDTTISITVPTEEFTYNGKAVTAGTANADITYGYTGDGNVTTTWYASNGNDRGTALKSAPVDAGTYYIGVKATAGTNYNEVAEQFKKFTISKATASIIIADPGEITYDGKVVKADVATAEDLDDVDITYTKVGDGDVVIDWYKGDTKLDDAPKDAGNYSVKISAKEGTNYEAATEQEKAFTILPATATITINDPGTITYDGEVVTIGKEAAAEGTETVKYDITYTYDGDNANPTITWYSSDSKGDMGETLTEAPKSAGTYYVGISAAATNNYKAVTEVTQKFTITKKSSSGGGSASTVQKPVINNGDNGTYKLSTDGTTVTLTPNTGYEIDKVTVNGNVVTPKDGKVTGLKTGDNVNITYKKADSAIDEVASIKDKVAALELKARSSKTSKGNVKVVAKLGTAEKTLVAKFEKLGYTVKYRFYRSTKKSSGYKAMLTGTTGKYTNTIGKAGTRYYYKVQIRIYDKDGKLVAKTALKQCKYATRQWTKK